MVSWTPWMLVVGLPLLAAVAGVIRRNAARPDRVPLLAAGVAGIAFAVLAATTHDPDVPVDDAVLGIAAAGVVLGALPVYLFFVLGRALANHRVTLGLVCAAAVVPLGYFYLVGWILVLAFVYCPPDAYECPF
jgi:hypothetical protein